MFITKAIQPFGIVLTARHSHGEPIGKLNIDLLQKLIYKHKVVVLRGVLPSTDREYVDFCGRLGEVMRWEFGEILNVNVRQNPTNHIFSEGRVELHWDGAFALETPKFIVFQCISSTVSLGGDTLFTNTSKLVEELDPETFSAWSKVSITYKTEKKAHYGGEINIKLIQKHPDGNEKTLRFIEVSNEDCVAVNPIDWNVAGLEQHEDPREFLEIVTNKLYSPKCLYQHPWEAGDYIFVDNFAVLHGRASLRGNISRHLKRIHVL